MAYKSIAVTATGATTAFSKPTNDTNVTVAINGTYATTSFTFEASVDGTNFDQIFTVDGKTGLLVAGGTSLSPTDAANYSWSWPAGSGFSAVRLNVSAIASGTLTVKFISSAVTSQPYIVNAATTGTFTNGTFSGTLAVTGVSTLTGAVNVGAEVAPSSNDGAPLGDLTHNWSDLFLASGAVVNYANSNVVITHSSGILTMGTGDFRVTTAGTNTASVVTVGGTQTLAAKTLTTPIIGVATGTSLAVTGLVTSSSPTAGIGYATGAGGTVTQITSRTTGVTLNTVCGNIVLFSAAGSATPFSFTLTNSTIAVGDVVRICQKSGTDLYTTQVVTAVGAGSCQITLANASGTTTEQPVFNFSVSKGVAA